MKTIVVMLVVFFALVAPARASTFPSCLYRDGWYDGGSAAGCRAMGGKWLYAEPVYTKAMRDARRATRPRGRRE